AILRGIVRGVDDASLEAPVVVAKPDASAQRNDKAAALAKGVAADRFGHRHDDIAAARWIESVERRGVDVDPVEHLLIDRPQRTFAEARAGVEHAGKAGGGCG